MDCIFWNIYSSALLLMSVGYVSCQTYDNAQALRSALLSNYHKDIRPLNNQSTVVHVNLSMVLYGMPEVDDVKGVISLTAATQALWMDERIIWNASDYGGISKMLILKNEVWTPSVSLGTPAEFAVMGLSQSHVTFYDNGLAVFFPAAVLESTCRFNMRFWPFDKQVCEVSFFTLDYTTDQIIISVPANGFITDFFTPNAEWTLEDTSFYTKEVTGFSMAVYKLKLKRQSLFYVLTIILPINGIIGLTSLIFLLPSASGERVSYAVTIMLSLAVFLTVVSAEIPKNSQPISLMCCYILAGIAVSIIGTVAAIFNLDIYHRNENIPKRHLYMSLVRLFRCKRSNKVHDKPEKINGSTNTKQTLLSGQFPVKRMTSQLSVVSVTLSESAQAQEEVITWQDVSHAIDKLLLFAIIILAYIPSVCFLIYLGTATDYQ